MSYAYDTMERVWEALRKQLPKEVAESETVTRFGFMIADMHEANHQLKDAINRDARVSRMAVRLDDCFNREKEMLMKPRN